MQEHSPDVGSSRNSKEGAPSMPAATDSRFLSPPDSPRKFKPPGSVPPTCAQAAAEARRVATVWQQCGSSVAAGYNQSYSIGQVEIPMGGANAMLPFHCISQPVSSVGRTPHSAAYGWPTHVSAEQ